MKLDLAESLRAAVAGPPLAFYTDPPDGDGILVHAAVPVAAGVSVGGCVMVDLPAIEAATIVHRGPMTNIVPTGHSLHTWIGAHGYRSDGYFREVYHEYGSGDPPPTHAWFVAFRGDLAVAVLVEGGGVGGQQAAPIAGRVFTQLPG